MKAHCAVICFLLRPGRGPRRGTGLWRGKDLRGRGDRGILQSRLQTALASWEKALAADPNNPQRHNNIAYALLYREMFRNGALESELVSGNNSFIRRAENGTVPRGGEEVLCGDRPLDGIVLRRGCAAIPGTRPRSMRWPWPMACAPTTVFWCAKAGACRFTIPARRANSTRK